jgi:hypothetical protein
VSRSITVEAKILMVIALMENVEISRTFHHLLTLFARAKGFLRSELLILMMKMVNYVILKNLRWPKLHKNIP